jgi:hypothetical protein
MRRNILLTIFVATVSSIACTIITNKSGKNFFLTFSGEVSQLGAWQTSQIYCEFNQLALQNNVSQFSALGNLQYKTRQHCLLAIISGEKALVKIERPILKIVSHIVVLIVSINRNTTVSSALAPYF